MPLPQLLEEPMVLRLPGSQQNELQLFGEEPLRRFGKDVQPLLVCQAGYDTEEGQVGAFR